MSYFDELNNMETYFYNILTRIFRINTHFTCANQQPCASQSSKTTTFNLQHITISLIIKYNRPEWC